MTRAADGTYNLPSGSLVNAGDIIAPSQHNPPLQDIEAAITGSLSRDGYGGMRADLNAGGFRITNVTPGTQPTDAATVSQVNAASGVPAGSLVDFAGSTAPTGWLICAGQSLSRTAYPDLFTAIGTTYGAPTGDTFNIPDCRGRVTAGRDVDSGGFAGRLTTPNSQTLGATGGAQNVVLTEAQMPVHTHVITGGTDPAGSHSHNVIRRSETTGSNEVVPVDVANGTMITTGAAGEHSHALTASAADAGGGQAHAIVQPTIVLTKIIKTSNS